LAGGTEEGGRAGTGTLVGAGTLAGAGTLTGTAGEAEAGTGTGTGMTTTGLAFAALGAARALSGESPEQIRIADTTNLRSSTPVA